MLELKNIYFYKDNKQILTDVSLNIDNQKFVAITGPNGSGKSTLAKIIMGLFSPDSGQIILMDKILQILLLQKELNLVLVLLFNNLLNLKVLLSKT